MPSDLYGIVEKAVEGMRSQDSLRLEVAPLEMELTATQLDSSNAAAALAEIGAACIVTMGGDGTNRMVAKCCGDVPLLPISTGTNNVFPLFLKRTIAGIAAGVVIFMLVPGLRVLKEDVYFPIVEPSFPLNPSSIVRIYSVSRRVPASKVRLAVTAESKSQKGTYMGWTSSTRLLAVKAAGRSILPS